MLKYIEFVMENVKKYDVLVKFPQTVYFHHQNEANVINKAFYSNFQYFFISLTVSFGKNMSFSSRKSAKNILKNYFKF